MVAYNEIEASNALIDDATAPKVAVFVGGTSGIGKLTAEALVATGASVKIYIVGRKSSEDRTKAFINDLHTTNPKAEVVWVEGEVSLLAETKRVCDVIASKESRVDLLFLTTGYAPFGGRIETAEGLEITQSLEYYTRILFAIHLLPLLKAAAAPRVISVLAGGMEKSIDLEDLDLKKPGNFSALKAQPQFGAMNTLALEKLAIDNPDVTFIHSWPGWVNTGNSRRGSKPTSMTEWMVWTLAGPLVGCFAMTDEASAQRNLFLSTSAAFGGRGVPWKGKPGINTLGKSTNGLFLPSYKCDCANNGKALASLREKAQEKVWDHTQEILGPYL